MSWIYGGDLFELWAPLGLAIGGLGLIFRFASWFLKTPEMKPVGYVFMLAGLTVPIWVPLLFLGVAAAIVWLIGKDLVDICRDAFGLIKRRRQR